jgi:hypothetical protein
VNEIYAPDPQRSSPKHFTYKFGTVSTKTTPKKAAKSVAIVVILLPKTSDIITPAKSPRKAPMSMNSDIVVTFL